jgi:macrolide transport system ATP-binding/permease protein
MKGNSGVLRRLSQGLIMLLASQLVFHRVAFAYEGSVGDIFRELSVHFPAGWSGIVGENGAGKTTLLQLAAGALLPSAGHVQRPGAAVYCAQRTDEAPHGLAAFVADRSAAAAVLRRRLHIDANWSRRWDSLSHGERKRAQLAVALWLEPVLLALDEPTNHLDEDGSALVAQALGAYDGVGLLVSHDRVLLDALCRRCLFVHAGAAVLRPGSYSLAVEQERREQESARRDREHASTELRRLARQQQLRRAKAEQSRSRRPGRRADRKDSDARAKRQLAIVSGKDGQAGRLLAQMERRVERARRQAESIDVEKVERAGIWMPGARSRRRFVSRLDEGDLSLGEARHLRHPTLTIGSSDRVALTGPNGSGKSTLVRELVGRNDLEAARLVYLPQEVPIDAARSLLEDISTLDDAALGRLLTVYSRLGSRPGRLLESRLPSPGETRKLLLALGVACEPHLIVMDEPTNHLDLPAIEALESALEDCPCALLLVSHDRRFLERLATTEWHLMPDGDTEFRLEKRARVAGDSG